MKTRRRTTPKVTKLQIPKDLDPEGAILLLKEEMIFLARSGTGAVVQKRVSAGAVREAFIAQPIDSGWLPAGVNRWGVGPKGHWLLRWHAPQQYKVFLPEGRRATLLPMPALVFFGQGDKYYIWAMRGQKFDPKGQLFNAPCANVSDLGLVCWGSDNAKLEAKTGFEKMWETFWLAPFNNNWASGKSRATQGSINQVLFKLAKQNAKKYPEMDLMPVMHRLLPQNVTLDQIVEVIARKGASE